MKNYLIYPRQLTDYGSGKPCREQERVYQIVFEDGSSHPVLYDNKEQAQIAAATLL